MKIAWMLRSLPKPIVLLIFATTSFAEIAFDRYHRFDEIAPYLQSKISNHCQYILLGESEQGRPMSALRCGVRDGTKDELPSIVINAAHHGDEPITTEAALALIRSVTSQHEIWQPLLERINLVIIPAVNPDGLVAGSRRNSRGIDLNRDYPVKHGDAWVGSRSREVATLRAYLASLKLKGAVALHAGTEAVFWPWGYKKGLNPDHALFQLLGAGLATTMGFATIRQSYDDYPTTGEFIDYAYDWHRAFALTFEISQLQRPNPQTLEHLTARTNRALRQFISLLLDQQQLAH